jgi:hypothetical protein
VFGKQVIRKLSEVQPDVFEMVKRKGVSTQRE